MQKKAVSSHPLTPQEALSKITSKLKRLRGKNGLYIICLNATKAISPEDFEQLKEATRALVKFLLQDPNNWVGVFSLNDRFKYVENSSFCQKYPLVEAQIKGIKQQITKPLTVLNHFVTNWKKDSKTAKNYDTFVIVMSPTTFNPDANFFKSFAEKKLHLVPCVFGNHSVVCKEQTLKFTSSIDLHSKFRSLIAQTDSLDCKIEIVPEYSSVLARFITNIEDPELELRVIKKAEGQYVPVDVIFTNRNEIRIGRLEPGCQYILKYRFNFSDGFNSSFFDEVHFQTLSQSIRDVELMPFEQAKQEVEKMKEAMTSLTISNVEKLMGIHAYNILLFGRIGAGKSSFASTVHRAGTGQFNPNFAYVDFSYKSCTKELNKLELFNCSPIRLWDTFGIDDTNYEDHVLENILDGRVKDLFKPGDVIPKKEVKLGDCVHTVIIVFDVQMFADEEDVEKIRKKVNKIKEKKHYPILIITKLDTLKGKTGPSISCRSMYQIKNSDDIIARAHQVFRIDKNNIFFMINYRGEEPQDLYKELVSLRILQKGTERAKQFITQRKKILIKEVNGKFKKIIPLARDDISLSEFRMAYGAQIAKLLKNEDFKFVEYEPEEEEDVNLNEIDQIDEEHGEKLKFLNVAKTGKGKYNLTASSHLMESMDDSVNQRAEESSLLSKTPLWQHQEVTSESQEMSKTLSKGYLTKTRYENPLDEDMEQVEIAPGLEFNLEDSKDEDVSFDIGTEREQDAKNEDIVVEDYSPYEKKRIIAVIDNSQEIELEDADLSSSLYRIRKRITEEFPAIKEKYFAFTKKIDDKDLAIPDVYENESAIKLEQVVKDVDNNTTKFYIKSQKNTGK